MQQLKDMLKASQANQANPKAGGTVTVKFENAPKGTRVTSDAKAGDHIELSVGYLLSFI